MLERKIFSGEPFAGKVPPSEVKGMSENVDAACGNGIASSTQPSFVRNFRIVDFFFFLLPNAIAIGNGSIGEHFQSFSGEVGMVRVAVGVVL